MMWSVRSVRWTCLRRFSCIQEERFTRKRHAAQGTGGRSSWSGLVVTVFGASGFLGRVLVNRLGKIGSLLVVPYRGDAEEVRDLRLAVDLGQIVFCPYNLKDEASIWKAIRYSNVVINLVGREWETREFPYEEVHVKGARRIARLSRESGVGRLVHVSALNAGGCRFLASKRLGEAALLEEFPGATVFRPADMFGPGDTFVRYFSSMYRHQVKWLPLYRKGECTVKQPVYVGDVAQGIVTATRDPKTAGKIYQAIGENRYLLSELVDWFHRIMRKSKDWGYRRYDMKYDPLFKLRVLLGPWLALDPKRPPYGLHRDKVAREAVSDTVDRQLPTLKNLGVSFTSIEEQAPWILRHYRAHSYYDYSEEIDTIEPIEPPKRIQHNF